MTQVLVVLPTFQEADNIEPLVRQLRRVLPEAVVIVVDDDSPDGTAEVAERLGHELGGVEVMRRARKAGYGGACRAGFAWGLERGFDVLVQMDADFSHDPGVLPHLVETLESRGADVVIGSRYVPGGSIPDWPLHRRLLSRYGNAYARRCLRLGLSDLTTGYRVWRSATLKDIDAASTRADGYGFLIETAYRASRLGHRVVEAPIRFVDRSKGKSKMSGRIMLESLALVTWWGVRDRARSLAGPRG